jgi:rhodanese-related sulfurtransferase
MFSFFKKKYQNIDVPTFKELKRKRDTVILDVRTRGEQVNGVINGQRNMNVMDTQFRNNVSKLDKEKTYLIYCQSGRRSARASKIMANQGFENVYNLKGGFNAWKREED